MYSKDELLSKNISELEDIAQNLGAQLNANDSQEDIVYSILDKQAEVEGNKNPLGTKRKRVRIAKKDTDKVYTVKGNAGENFDLKKSKTATNEQLPLFNDTDETKVEDKTVTPVEEAPAPKRRGRKPKALKLAEQAAAEAAAAAETAAEINGIKDGILLQNSDGQLVISKATLEELVNNIVKGFDSAQDVSSKIVLDEEKNLIVYVTLNVKENAVIKELSNNLQTKIKSAIKKTSDLEVKEVNISVKDLNTKEEQGLEQ